MRVVEDPDPRVSVTHVAEQFSGSVARPAVDEDELDVAVVVLAPHRRYHVSDTRLFIEDGNQDADIRHARAIY
jgi:hypothetical protein